MGMTRERSLRFELKYTPAAVASENAKLLSWPAGYMISDIVARVITAADSDGTVSLGSTSGGTDLATTGNMGVTSTGLKVAAVANKVVRTTDGYLWANYTVGTDTVAPVIIITGAIKKVIS